MSLLQIQNVNFSYSDTNNDQAFFLRDIILSVARGEFISILGPNGSGKSTLLKLISGVLQPKTGKICIDDENIHNIDRRKLARKIAFVPQTFSVAFPFSVMEIVMMGRTPYLNHYGYERENDVRIAEEALKNVGIYHLKDHGINEVSGGEAQRAFIARALAQQPDILLLDEPNAHLDIEHQVGVFKILEKLNQERQITVLVISHDLNLIGYFGSRIILMKDGIILLDDIPQNILTERNLNDVFNVNSVVKVHEESNYVSVNIIPK